MVKSLVYGPILERDARIYLNGDTSSDIPDTLEIMAHLNDYIIGQEDVKKALAVAAVRHMHTVKYNHEIRLKETRDYFLPAIYNYLREDDHEYNFELKKQNIMIIGPSGTGKTLTISKLAEFMGVPYYIADATSLTAAGYVGESVDTILEGLMKNSSTLEEAQKGIIFIDEVDKICASSDSDRRDVGGLEVQHALLKLIEGGIVNVGGDSTGPMSKATPFDTSDVLFIFGGAFTALREILNKKSEKTPIGFGTEAKKKHLKITVKDLIAAGMSTEFMGRISTVVETKDLTKDQLRAIMTEPKDAILKQYRVIFKLMGKKWDTKGEKKLIDKVVDRAILTKTGARGINTIMEEELRNKLYE